MVDFLHLCENAATSEKANNLLVPPVKAWGGYKKSIFQHCSFHEEVKEKSFSLTLHWEHTLFPWLQINKWH